MGTEPNCYIAGKIDKIPGRTRMMVRGEMSEEQSAEVKIVLRAANLLTESPSGKPSRTQWDSSRPSRKAPKTRINRRGGLDLA